MLQELQPEPTAVDVLTAIINAKQPDILTELEHSLYQTRNSIADKIIQAGLEALLKKSAANTWLPKSFADLEAEWKTYRESQIRRPL